MEIDEEIKMATNGDGDVLCSSTAVKDENRDNNTVQTTNAEAPGEACQIEEDDEIDQEKGKENVAQSEPKKKIDQGGNAEEAYHVKEDDKIVKEKGNKSTAKDELKKKIYQSGIFAVELEDKSEPLDPGAAFISFLSPEADTLPRN